MSRRCPFATARAMACGLIPLFIPLIVGCAGDDPGRSRWDLQPPARPSRQVVTDRQVLGTSVQGRAIEMQTFGNGPNRVLILGGIHGDEVTSVDVTRALADLLHRHPDVIPPDRTIAVIPVVNPDGYAVRTRTNSRGVDLNRNFPARNFQPGGGAGFRGGPAPLSEPESRAIMSALIQTRPRMIISIHSIRGGRHQNNYDGPAEPLARLLAEHNGYPVTDNIGYPTPGSLGSYAGHDLLIPIITLELPRDQPAEEAWETNRAALLAAIRW